jgi:predicted RNA-binding protein YlxR (DUF448 family)
MGAKVPQKHRKHVPLRTCIACRQKRAKRELIRVVRTPEGTIEVDLRGKASGRGAYLCPNRQCWEAALEQGRLGRALKCQVTAQDVMTLREALTSLLTEDGQV